MRFARLFLIAALTFVPVVAGAGDRVVAALDVTSTPALNLSVTRQTLPEGGMKLRLLVQRASGKTVKSMVLYEGGGGDDGPGEKDFRSVKLSAFDLPAETRGVRVDFEFTIPGSRTKRQIDSFLVSVDGTPRTVLEATTHKELDRSRVCHEVEEAQIVSHDDGKLFVRPSSDLESEVSDDDDSPIDKSCQGLHAGKEIVYQFDGETFHKVGATTPAKRVDAATPPPAVAPKAKDDDGDDD
jgi:hypothetical protein